MKRIKLDLTEDQARFLKTLIEDHVIYTPVKQSFERRNFAKRILTALYFSE